VVAEMEEEKEHLHQVARESEEVEHGLLRVEAQTSRQEDLAAVSLQEVEVEVEEALYLVVSCSPR